MKQRRGERRRTARKPMKARGIAPPPSPMTAKMNKSEKRGPTSELIKRYEAKDSSGPRILIFDIFDIFDF